MLSLSPGKFQKSDELEVTRLRLSRNDNPFVQKVLASRDNVTDVIDDTESDDAILILMSDVSVYHRVAKYSRDVLCSL